jgi:D12 class N6 adenine-specific DNA methyltransferase.
MKASKNYNSSPLPFMGQKRRFLTKFKIELESFNPGATYVDLFGGSGLLSHTVKQHCPDAQVIYNDYDNFSKRLEWIPKTNKLIQDIRDLISDLPKDKAIPFERRQSILDRIYSEEKHYGYVDYITLSSNLLFAMNNAISYDEFARQVFYNTLRETPYSALGYLDGVQRVSMDYRELFELYRDQSNIIFLVDPPYLSTDVSTYKSSHWKLSDYLDILDVLDVEHYFYFTSNKSNVVELCEWIAKKVPGSNPFACAVAVSHVNNPNYHSKFTDIMLVKR